MSIDAPSVRSVVSSLGGVAETARLLNCGETAVHNMIARDAFPARTFFPLRDALVERGIPVPEQLLGRRSARAAA